MAKALPTITRRIPLFALDSRFTVKWKFLFDSMPHDYTGYIDIWDTIPWQTVAFDDGETRDHNYASQAQFRPSYGGTGDYIGIFDRCVESGLPEDYCHNCQGLVGDLIALLEHDGIADEIIEAQYTHDDAAESKGGAETVPIIPHDAIHRIPLRNLPFKEFNSALPFPETFPCGFARPMTYRYRGRGHLGDNGEACFFVRESNSYDGTLGMKDMFPAENHRHEFWSDVAWFTREIDGADIVRAVREPPLPADAKLAIYFQACGAIVRVRINGTWHILSEEFHPPYGNPYIGFCFRGKKFTIPLTDCGLHTGAGETNEFVIEYFAIRGEGYGANVIFALEYKETIHEEAIMPEEKKKPPSKGGAFGDIVGRWKIMIANLAAEIQGFVDAQPFYNSLQQIIADAETLNAEQEELKGLLKAKTDELYKKLDDGDKNYASLVRYLKMKFGPDAPILTKYIPAAEGEVDKTKEGYGDKEQKPTEVK